MQNNINKMQNDIVKIDNLKITYPTKNKLFTAVNNISIKVAKGEIVGLIGESGAGKSTIGRALVQLLDAPGIIAGGELFFKGENITRKPIDYFKSIRGSKIGYIFQDPMTSLNPVLTIGLQLTEVLEANLGITGKEAKHRAIELLKLVEINDAESRFDAYPHQLSGGLRQRVVIAIALSSDPDLIIADEPTTALDVTIQRSILNTLKKLCREKNIAVILVTHDMGVISETCDRIYILKNGDLVGQGKTHDVLTNPSHPYIKSLINAIPRLDVKLNRFPDLHIEHIPSKLEQAAMAYLKAGHSTELDTSKPILTVSKLTKVYGSKNSLFSKKQGFKAVDDVSFHVNAGETLGIVGESGSGKSTIGRMILGLTEVTSGCIVFNGRDLSNPGSKSEQKQLRRELQVIFQDPYSSLDPRMKIRDIIGYPMKLHNLVADKESFNQIIEGLLEKVGLSAEDAEKYPHQFSGGQRQRIGIARALALRPRFIFCDEPTSALDVSVQANVLNLLKDLQEELGLTLLFVSHDLAVIRQMCDRAIVMNTGKICELGDNEQIFTQPKHAYTKELIAAMPHIDF